MNQEQGALKEAAQKAASNLDYKGNSQAEPSQTDEMNDNTVQVRNSNSVTYYFDNISYTGRKACTTFNLDTWCSRKTFFFKNPCNN